MKRLKRDDVRLNDYWQAPLRSQPWPFVDMEVWHWMYDHPDASACELRDATLDLSRQAWNRYYAPVLGQRDSHLLAVYSHMVSYPLYLANYPLGHLIARQIQEKIDRAGSVGPEFERMARIGRIAPDLWMRQATGTEIGPQALLKATERALESLDAH